MNELYILDSTKWQEFRDGWMLLQALRVEAEQSFEDSVGRDLNHHHCSPSGSSQKSACFNTYGLDLHPIVPVLG